MKKRTVYTERMRSVYPKRMRRGQVLVVGIVFMSVVLILSASLFSRVSNFMGFSSTSIVSEQANNLAEAGIDHTLWQLNKTAGTYIPPATETQVGTTGTFLVSVTNKSSNLKTITATGFVPNSANSKAKRTIKIDAAIDSQEIAFHYAVQVGTGGVSMSNNSTINGSVFSNKTGVSISGSNGSIINGDAWAAGTITSPNPIILGNKHENEAPSDFPSIDNQPFIDEATNGGTITCSPTCTLSTSDFGPKKYEGNVLITNGAIMNMLGHVYITGNLTVDNNAKVNLNNSFGSNGKAIVVNDTVTVSNNGVFNPTNASPKGYILVITNSTSVNAMSIANNGANAVFYALFGSAVMSNNSSVNALVAKQLTMGNNSTLNYDTGLASANFVNGPGASWLMKKGTYKFSQ